MDERIRSDGTVLKALNREEATGVVQQRTSTSVANAYVKPLTGRYLAKLSNRLSSIGFGGKLFIMLSSGGITSVETAAEFPVRIIQGYVTVEKARTEYGVVINEKTMGVDELGTKKLREELRR